MLALLMHRAQRGIRLEPGIAVTYPLLPVQSLYSYTFTECEPAACKIIIFIQVLALFTERRY